MKTKIGILLFAFCLFSSLLFAQAKSFNVGVDVFPNFISDYSDSKHLEPKLSASIGMVLAYQLNERFSLESGLKYVNRGVTQSFDRVYLDQIATIPFSMLEGEKETIKVSFNYLSIPLNVRIALAHHPSTDTGCYLRLGFATDYFLSRNPRDKNFLYKIDNAIVEHRASESSIGEISLSVNTGIGYSFLINKDYQMSIEPAVDFLLYQGGSSSYQSLGLKFRLMVL